MTNESKSCQIFVKIKGFGDVRVKGVGGHNAISYEGVGLGFN